MSDTPVDLKSNTNYVFLKNLQDEYVVPRTSLAAVDLVAGNGLRVSGNTIYTADASVDDIIYGTGGSGVVTPAGLKDALANGLLANANMATVDDILSGTAGQVIDPNGLKSALTVAQAADVTTLGATTMGGDLSALNYTDTFTLTGTSATNKYGFGINGAGTEDETNYPKYADGLKYLFIADMKLAGGNFTSIEAMADGGSKEMLIDGGSLSDYNWHRFAFEFSSKMAYFVFNISNGGSVQLKNVRQYEVTALTDDAIKALAGFEDPDDFEYSHIVDQNMINPWLQIIDMGSSPEVLVYPGLSYKINAQNNNVKLSVPSIPANKSGLDSYVELYVGGEGSIAVQRPLVLGSTITPYSTNQCTVKFRDGRAVLTIDEVSQDYVVTVASGVEGTALEGSLYYGLVYATANQIAFNSGLDGEVISLPDNTVIGGVRDVSIKGNGAANTKIGNCAFIVGSTQGYPTWATLEDLTITGATYATGYQWLFTGTMHSCAITGNTMSTSLADASFISVRGASPSVGFLNCIVTGNTVTATRSHVVTCNYTVIVQGSSITNNTSVYSLGMYAGGWVIDCVVDGTARFANSTVCTITGSVFNNIHLYAGGKITFDRQNSIVGQILDITHNCTLSLTATSILDLSNNTHAAVASGGTVSAAAGAKIIALGGNTVTISANTSGSYLLNNGTITSDVYIVTVGGNSTGSGSLIYGMTASSAGNILFDSSVDGQTVTIPETATVGRNLNIVGNGLEATYMVSSFNCTAGITSISNLCWVNGVILTTAQKLTLSYCDITNAALSGNLVNAWSYDSAALEINNCTFHDIVGWNNLNGGIIYCPANHSYYIRDTSIVNTRDKIVLITYNSPSIYLSNCYINNPNNNYTCIYLATAGAMITISGSTLASYKDILIYSDNTNKGVFTDYNVVNSSIGGLGQTRLVANSTLDLTSNSNSVVVYGASPSSASITGTTINVVASTASDAAIGGTATVLYNDNGVTKERKLTGGGAGYIMRNNGAWGVPVTVASGTASGSLYALIRDTSITNITFAPVVDGSSVTYSGAWRDFDPARTFYLNGAGKNITVLTGRMFGTYPSGQLHMADISCKGTTDPVSVVTARNCVFDSCSVTTSFSSNQSASTFVTENRTGVLVEGCTFSHMHSKFANYGYFQTFSNNGLIKDCLFIDNGQSSDDVKKLSFNNNYGWHMDVTGCTFTNAQTLTLQGGQSTGGNTTFTDCIFNASNIFMETAAQYMTFSGTNILNSTVSGAGTVVFADGATVTSTIPSGSTIGTGVISCPFASFAANTKATLENISITGVSASTSIFRLTSENAQLTLTNCSMSGNSTPTSSFAVYTQYASNTVYLTGCTIAATGAASHNGRVYIHNGVVIMNNTSVDSFQCYNGYLIIKGDCTVSYNTYSSDSGQNLRYVIEPNAMLHVVTLPTLPSPSAYYVGVYDETTKELSITGTATVVLNGTTVTISGSGTTIDSTGLHS